MNDALWHLVALVMAGGSYTLLIDGIEESSLVKTVNTSSDLNVYIEDCTYRTRFWNGNIDEVRLWSIALSSTQITSLKDTEIADIDEDGLVDQNQTINWVNLQLYYHFDKLGDAGEIVDLSGNHRSGSLINGATLGEGIKLSIVTGVS